MAYSHRLVMLKDRERRILDFMKNEITTKGYPPTVREICSACNIKSTSTCHKDIASLVKQGYLKKDPSKTRALMVVDLDRHEDTNSNLSRIDNVINVPIVGRVAAGYPITAVENLEGEFPIPAQYIKGDLNFMLRVKGESMIEAGILDGDLILVEKTPSVRNGEIVVAMIDGFESEATVKTFYKENGHIRLQPENSTMSPIIVNDAKIVGKVKGVFRYFS